MISDFVDRVGDQIGIVAADGSVHRSEALVADALRALAYTATGGHTLPASTAVAYPAHWTTSAVDALGAALGRVPEWSPAGQPLLLIPDAAAALFAARANPGIPARGVVAVCDFGGSGTSITLADASGEYQPLGATVRHPDFSGDLIDQSLLTYVMSEMPATGSFDPSGTSAIGSLNRLRAECRQAKEQLSLSTVATLSDALPGVSGEVRLTRNELDETIRDSLDGFARVVEHTLQRAGVPAADLVAIVTVGGGANIPSVTTTLSGRFGVPVITAPRPQLTAATGGALRAARGPGDSSATVLTSAAPMTQTAMAPLDPDVGAVAAADAPVSALQPALAWSEADDQSRAMPVVGDDYSGASGYTSARPQLTFDRECPGGAGAQVRGDPVVPPARSNHRRNGGCGAARRRRGRDRAELRRTAGDSLARSDHVPAHLGPRSRATGDRCRNFRARAVHSATCLPGAGADADTAGAPAAVDRGTAALNHTSPGHHPASGHHRGTAGNHPAAGHHRGAAHHAGAGDTATAHAAPDPAHSPDSAHPADPGNRFPAGAAGAADTSGASGAGSSRVRPSHRAVGHCAASNCAPGGKRSMR